MPTCAHQLGSKMVAAVAILLGLVLPVVAGVFGFALVGVWIDDWRIVERVIASACFRVTRGRTFAQSSGCKI